MYGARKDRCSLFWPRQCGEKEISNSGFHAWLKESLFHCPIFPLIITQSLVSICVMVGTKNIVKVFFGSPRVGDVGRRFETFRVTIRHTVPRLPTEIKVWRFVSHLERGVTDMLGS